MSKSVDSSGGLDSETKVNNDIFEIRVLDGRIVRIPKSMATRIPVFAAYIARWNTARQPFDLPYSMKTVVRMVESLQTSIEDYLGIEVTMPVAVPPKMETLDDIMLDNKLRPEIRALFKFKWSKIHAFDGQDTEWLVTITLGAKKVGLKITYRKDSLKITVGHEFSYLTSFNAVGITQMEPMFKRIERNLLDQISMWFNLLK